MFSFIEKVFSKSSGHFPNSAIFEEFGVNFFAIFARSKSEGMLFNLRGLQKLFSSTEKVFSKCYRHFRIFCHLRGIWGYVLAIFARRISAGILFNLLGLEKCCLL